MLNPLFYVLWGCIGWNLLNILFFIIDPSMSAIEMRARLLVLFASVMFLYYYYRKHLNAWYIATIISPLLYLLNTNNWYEPIELAWPGYLVLFLVEIYMLSLYKPYVEYIDSWDNQYKNTDLYENKKQSYSMPGLIRGFVFLGIYYLFTILKTLYTTDNAWEVILNRNMHMIAGVATSVSIIVCYYYKSSYIWWPVFIAIPLINILYLFQNSDGVEKNILVVHVLVSAAAFIYVVMKCWQEKKSKALKKLE